MKITCLASSSTGNCYVIDDGHNKLLLEGGIPFKKIVSKLNEHQLKFSDFVGCLVSHSHNDHAKAIRELSRFIQINGSKETLEHFFDLTDLRIINNKIWTLYSGLKTKLKTYEIIPFSTEHDCPGSLGFIIKSNTTNEIMLFATDTKYILYNLSRYKFDSIMIECNYNEELLDIQDINPALKKRLINSHMSLTTCVKTLKSFDLSRCKEIYLIHLSASRSDEKLMKNTVASEFGIATYVCGKNGGVS